MCSDTEGHKQTGGTQNSIKNPGGKKAQRRQAGRQKFSTHHPGQEPQMPASAELKAPCHGGLWKLSFSGG